jgi:dTDP-4-amino-4,6-dideoxygalactose transaminase
MENFRIVDPVLPEPKDFLKYYEMSQKERHYSNGGPCVRLLEERFEKLLNSNVVSCNNATSGLTAVLSVLRKKMEIGTHRIPDYKTVVAMSDFTYAATACAIESAGCKVQAHDINSEYAIDYRPLCTGSNPIDARIVVVTCPFGAIPFHTIEALTRNKGLKIVVDAAATLGLPWKDIKRLVKLVDAVVFSLHATKTFGIGEGGLVVSKDVVLAEETRDFMCFNLQRRKIYKSVASGMNGKMPEISAAIALAKLDNFESDNNRRIELAQDFIMEVMVEGMELYPFEHSYQVIPFIVKDNTRFETALNLYRIPFRKYYEAPLGNFSCYMSRTAHKENICLPFSERMTKDQIKELKHVLKIYEYMRE